MKINHRILALAAAIGLLAAGCATDHSNSGAMGNDSETGYGSDASPVAPASPAAPAITPDTSPNVAPMQNNGSVGPGNPFGAGPGSGLDRQ